MVVGGGLTSGPVPWLPEVLFAAGTNEGLGVYLFTLPACSALGYSTGMALAGVDFGWSQLTLLSLVFRVATIAIVWVALFSVLARQAQKFTAGFMIV